MEAVRGAWRRGRSRRQHRWGVAASESEASMMACSMSSMVVWKNMGEEDGDRKKRWEVSVNI